MPLPERSAAALCRLDASAVAGFIEALAAHEVRLLAGCDAATLADLLAVERPMRRPVLRLDLAHPGDAAHRIERAITQLAHAVAGLWPYLWDGEDFTQMRDDALSRAYLPLRLGALAARRQEVSRAWAQEIIPRLLRGGAPCLAERAPALEWRQLALAFAPDGLVVVAPLAADVAFVATVEWLARHAAVAVLVLAEAMPVGPPFERILYGAHAIVRSSLGARTAPEPPDAAAPLVIALPEAEGRPHPQSEVELKLYTLLQADAELQPLFVFNRFVPDVPLMQAKVDLLWASGRLVVEIDGPEHRGATKYRADRLRDYRLMLAGYRVLRMTNEDILTDAALALERIRDVVRLVQRNAR